MNREFVPCSRCGGKGCVPFTGKHADTLALLRRQRRPVSGAELARLDGCKPTAMNNRLVVLEGLGLATGEVCGRNRLWTATREKGGGE